MKSVKKDIVPNNTLSKELGIPTAGLSKTVNNSLSGSQKVEIIRAGLDVINSSSSLLTEIQKTKQAAIDAQARMRESDNKLFEKLAEFQKEIIRIEYEYEIESKKMDNDFKLKLGNPDLNEKVINSTIDSIRNLEVEIGKIQAKQGLDSPIVMALFNQLHELRLCFINKLSI